MAYFPWKKSTSSLEVHPSSIIILVEAWLDFVKIMWGWCQGIAMQLSSAWFQHFSVARIFWVAANILQTVHCSNNTIINGSNISPGRVVADIWVTHLTNNKSNQITFIVTSPQHKCLGEWNSYERAPDSAKKKKKITYGQYIFTEDNVQNTHTYSTHSVL